MAALGGIVSALPPANSNEKFAYTSAFVALACFAVTVTTWQARRGIKSEMEMQDEVTGLKTTISQLQSQVAELGKMNAELAKDSVGAVTGGDGFCRMLINHQFGYPTPIFVHSGKHSLYDVDVRITDLKKLKLGVRPSDIALKVPELHPGVAYINPTARLPFSDDQEQDFNIFLQRAKRYVDRKTAAPKDNGRMGERLSSLAHESA
jgi:hypothetical protein